MFTENPEIYYSSMAEPCQGLRTRLSLCQSNIFQDLAGVREARFLRLHFLFLRNEQQGFYSESCNLKGVGGKFKVIPKLQFL